MRATWSVTSQAAREALAGPTGAAGVGLVACTGQGDGCWLVDANGLPVGPAVLWNDSRAAGVVGEWLASDAAARLRAITGALPSPGSSGPILAWLAEHEPATVERATALLHCNGWTYLQLTGRRVLGRSDAAAAFLDLRTQEYSPDALAVAGIGWAERLLPSLLPEGEEIGELLPGPAASLGLPPGLPVVMAPYDVLASALGLGARDPGDACAIFGTTLCTEVVEQAVGGADAGAGDCAAEGLVLVRPRQGVRYHVCASLAGTGVVEWGARLLGLDGPAALGSLASAADPGAAGASFHPYLSAAGERAPFADPFARASLLGLTPSLGRDEIARAIMEGLAYVVRECLGTHLVAPTSLSVCGGGTSPEWCRLLADVTGLPVTWAGGDETGARGAVVAALGALEGRVAAANDTTGSTGTGVVARSSPPRATAGSAGRFAVPAGRTVQPDPERAGLYEQLWLRHAHLRDQLRETWPVSASPVGHAARSGAR